MRLTILCAILATLIAVVACGTARVQEAVDPAKWSKTVPLEEPPTTKREAAAEQSREEAQARLDRAEMELASAKLAIAQAKTAEAEARREAILAPLRRVAAITAATALVGFLACIALWFILPAGTKRAAVIGGGACLAVLCCAVAFHAALPYLAFAGGALVVGGVAWLIWRLHHTQQATAVVANSFDHLEAALRALNQEAPQTIDDLLGAVKSAAVRTQDELGVRKLIAGLRGKPIPAPPPKDLDPTPAG